MGNVVASVFFSLDGVMEAPEKWSKQYMNDQIMKVKLDELFAADAHLLGRATYEIFAGSWPYRTDDTGMADRLNTIAKYVASNTLQRPEWNNTTVLSGDVAEQVRKLKEEDGLELLIAGSGELVNSLLRHRLVDEVKLLVYPVVLGGGKRLFAEGTSVDLDLIENRDVGSGVVLQRYAPRAVS